MNTTKIEKRIKNLKRLKEIIEISKFNTINKLKSVQKTMNNTMERAVICKKLLENGIKKFHILDNVDPKKKVGDIFIYISCSCNNACYLTGLPVTMYICLSICIHGRIDLLD